MLNSRSRKNFIRLFSVVIVGVSLSFACYGQCGVYLKRVSTQVFPYPFISLDREEDMTGDGLIDLIMSGTQSGGGSFEKTRILILPNNGNGTFGAPLIINAPAQRPFHYQYMIGRINNDALKDIVVVFQSTLPLALRSYINNGNGTFTPGPDIPYPGSLGTILDVNADGFGDYVSVETGLNYRPGNGDGTFGSPVAITMSGGAGPGDFNNDGKVDFISTSTLYLNNGNGTFTTSNVSSFFTTGEFVNWVLDFNGDGRSDILTNTLFLLVKTDTSFIRTQIPPSNLSSGFSIVGNFSGSSAPDIIVTSPQLNRKVVYTNDGLGTFTRQEYDGEIFGFPHIDFDSDGKLDSVQIASNSWNSTVLFDDTTSLTLLKNVCNRPGNPRNVDFDRSQSTDFSFWNPTTGDWSFKTSDSLFQIQTVNWGLGSFGDIPVPGDFDGDGITDHAVYRISTGYWYIRRSSDLVWFVFKFGLTGDKPIPADYDGDTISDLAVWRPSDGNWYIWYMGPQQFSAVHFGLDGDKPVAADFDGDLKTDVAVYRPSTGVWYYLKSSDGNFAAIQWGISADKPIPADFDGDGKADISVYREANNFAYILRSYSSTGGYYQYGAAGDILQVGDYDGDFVDDLGVYRPSTGAWWTTTRRGSPTTIFGEGNVQPTSSILRVE